MKNISKPSSDNLRVALALIACAIGGVAGWASIRLLAGTASPKVEEIRMFVSMLAALDATLAGFLSASAALLYAVANTKLSVALRKSGHHRRVVIDLMLGMTLFIVGMVCSTFAAFPVANLDEATIKYLLALSCGTSAAAVFMLLPIGHAFWMLLTRIDLVEESASAPYDASPFKPDEVSNSN